MNRPRRFYLIILMLIVIFSGIYWLLPISGKIAYIPDSLPQIDTWPQVTIINKTNGELEVVVKDVTPWTFVRLELTGTETTPVEHNTQKINDVWQWKWLVSGTPEAATLNLYHSCDVGCQQWATVQTDIVTPIPNTNKLIPTKLGLVFASPQRDWHNRQGWDIEITYAQLAEDEFWGIDDLAQRVQQANRNGLRVLVRVEYDQGQSIPPPDDYAALDTYLHYLRRLARDQRLADVYGFIIGSNFNTAGANAQSPENLVSPQWYARIFNGYGADPDIHNNALEIIRNENRQARVLVGPVNPWDGDQNGDEVYQIDVPWLNYMHSVVVYINTAATAKSEYDISDSAPDGFAVQTFGRVDAEELSPAQRAQEPLLELRRENWGDAQAGFRIYQDWLNIINLYENTAGKPVYINATNTFDSKTGRFPAENYPAGWLSNALVVVNQEPQIQMLGWFIDNFPHDGQ